MRTPASQKWLAGFSRLRAGGFLRWRAVFVFSASSNTGTRHGLTFVLTSDRLTLSLMKGAKEMLVKTVPRCNNFVVDTSKSGNVACCNRVAWFGITLASGVVHYACVDCVAKRLAILADKLDTASIVFYIKDKKD